MVERPERPAGAAYDEPFAWWGPIWSPPVPRTVADLVRQHVMSPATAALLWALLARRASIAVVADPRGAGKTTLLTALLDFLPAGTRRLYLRGCYEPFAFLDDPTVEPSRSVLLVNEISAHLPSYLWGSAVRRVLQATARGFALAVTAHASSVEDLVAMLASYPLRIPPAEIAAIDIVVVLDVCDAAGEERRRVAGVWELTSPGPERLAVTRLDEGTLGRGISRIEINQRASALSDLTTNAGTAPIDVRAALLRDAGRWGAR